MRDESASHRPGPAGVPAQRALGTATALAPGTCGELVQGMTDGVDFLVTCPINQFSRVTATVSVGSSDPSVRFARSPGCFTKTHQAVQKALHELEERAGVGPLSAELRIANPIPVGKGMGSSSADITAAVSAVAAAAGVTLSPESIAGIALSVEPTDAVMFPGITLFDHRRGRIAQSLGQPPPMEVIVVDPGGQMDTLEFNSIDRTAQWLAVAEQTDAALELIREGILRDDPALVGRGATISAHAGHPEGAGEWVARAAQFAADAGAVGVNVAHSGTVVGILLDARKRHSKPVYRRALEVFRDAESVNHFRIIGGGVRT
jgi:L-threonine kinase